MERLFGKTYNLLGTMMDYRSERNKVISSNIANLDTKDYKSSDYVFKDNLKNAVDVRIRLTRTDEKHFPNAADEISKNDFKMITSDDKVDLDREMTNLAENHLMYNLTAELLARKFKGLRSVLTEAK
ncbi:MAG TPA: flagellar basal body rod protein FlgB [Smithellaceae bacterium]|jgi:flagellar basal-body rod protein FlgB|nr:flagellar basal body rod protein FlgB [Smithellaceae bacterium]HQM45108.1 flagellar basal body rod protein FlgB [Smithellaceae bacterium]